MTARHHNQLEEDAEQDDGSRREEWEHEWLVGHQNAVRNTLLCFFLLVIAIRAALMCGLF